MNWSDLASRVAVRTGQPESRVQQILRATSDAIVAALAEGEVVSLHGVGTLSSRWREPALVRTVGSHRKVRIDGRWVARFRAAGRLREALLRRTPQLWKDPAHQAAWRVADTLVGDLALYHGARAPGGLTTDAALPAVEEACNGSFGPLWSRCRSTYEAKVPPEVRASADYLALAARTRFAPAV